MSESLIGLPRGNLVGWESLSSPLHSSLADDRAEGKEKALGVILPMAFDCDPRLDEENRQAPGSLGD